MAAVSQGPNAFFRITPADAANARTFAVRRGDVIRRLDPRFNHPRYGILDKGLNSAQIATPELGELLKSISSGATPHRSDASLYADSGIKFLRILNIDDGEIVGRDIKHITAAVHNEALNRSRLAADDVLMTITGRVGSAAVVRESHLPANINQHIVRMRIDAKRCLPDFLSEWLNCPAGLELSNRGVSGGTRPALDYSAIRSIRIPLPVSLETQDGLVQDMNTARAARKAMLDEADALMASMDDFVLDALGIPKPVYEPKQSFAVRPSQLGVQRRLDSDYYHPERLGALSTLQAISGNLKLTKLADAAVFVREKINEPTENYMGLTHVESHTGEHTGSTNTASGACFEFQTDDVLFARLGSYLNKVYCAEMNGCCSTEFHVLRVNDPNALLPEYLAAALRSRIILAQTKHMAAGNTHPRLTNYDVENLLVPIPELEAQEAIVAEIRRRRQKARSLRAQADVVLRDAKRRFEAQLLGGVGNC